jgi:LysM repeat protein
MNCTIPFKKELEFKTTLGKIVSVSLEHEYTINEDSLLGNFIVTGEYKTHELSVNNEPFSFEVPFEVSLPEKLNKDTLNMDIDNFTYKVIEPNKMEINIEFTLKGEKKEEEDPLELINDNNERTTEETKTEELNDNHSESNLVEEETKKELRIDDEKQDNILSIASKSEETFVTYHIHLIKENETIESIMSQYQVSKDTLENYNDLSKFNLGEKLIIPCNE